MIVFLLLIIAIGAAAWYGRWHLLVHHPEHYAKFDVAEKAIAKATVAATERAVGSLVAAIKGMARLLGSKFNKA